MPTKALVTVERLSGARLSSAQSWLQLLLSRSDRSTGGGRGADRQEGEKRDTSWETARGRRRQKAGTANGLADRRQAGHARPPATTSDGPSPQACHPWQHRTTSQRPSAPLAPSPGPWPQASLLPLHRQAKVPGPGCPVASTLELRAPRGSHPAALFATLHQQVCPRANAPAPPLCCGRPHCSHPLLGPECILQSKASLSTPRRPLEERESVGPFGKPLLLHLKRLL